MADKLDSRPTATTYEVGTLVKMVHDGLIRVPDFQRTFRWDRKDVQRLFDSIIKGYPIGTLLLWIRSAPDEELPLGTLKISAPRRDRAFYAVDGQQRIISLANVVADSGQSDPRFALSYDLFNHSFVTSPQNPNAGLIPLPVLFNSARLIQWFAQYPQLVDHLEHATEVNSVLRQYPVPANQVEAEDIAILRDIFDRMNTYGKSLKRSEVFAALNTSSGDSERESLNFAQIAEHIHVERGFGLIDEDTVLKAILARRGVDVFRDVRGEFDNPDDEGKDAAFAAGEEALQRAVAFLQEDAHVPHISFLPHRYPLILLARFFGFYPHVDDRNRHLLRRWFWRTTVVGPGHFKGGATGAIRLLCRKVVANDAAGSIQDLLATVDGTLLLSEDISQFRANSATTKMLLCSWWALSPMNPETGAVYEQNDLWNALSERLTAGDVVRHIVARGGVSREFRSHAANRALMPGYDEDEISLRLPLQNTDATFKDVVLMSHIISPTAAELLRRGRVEEFLRERAQDVERELERFLRAMCEPGSDDSPSIVDLNLDDDEDFAEPDDHWGTGGHSSLGERYDHDAR